MTRRWRATAAWIATAALLATPFSANARPSLVEMDAGLQQVIDGLCHGDASLCGEAAPRSVAGQLDLESGLHVVDFADLRFSFASPSGSSLSFGQLEVSIAGGVELARIAEDLRSGVVWSSAELRVPDPQGTGNVAILELQDARASVLGETSGGFTQLSMSFTAANYSWLGNQASYDSQSSTASGCAVPSGDTHVDLRGNDASLLAGGEFEGSAEFTLTNPPSFAFVYERPLAPSSACQLRSAATQLNIAASFHGLSPLSDAFSSQLREASIDVSSARITAYELSIEGSRYRERVTLSLTSGSLTTRSFDPATGAQTATHTTALP